MSRGEELATQFEATNASVIAAVDSLSEAQWGSLSAAEHWSHGVVAHHIAVDHEAIAGLVQTIATGGTVPPLDSDALDAINAEHAAEAANCTKEETLALLRTEGMSAASMLRGLSDEQLDATAILPLLGPEPVTAAQVVENVLVGHINMHLESLQSAAS